MKKIFYLFILIFLTGTCLFGQKRAVPRSIKIYHDWKEGIVNIPEVSYGLGLSKTDGTLAKNFFGFTNITGYQFTKNFKAGVGYGVNKYNNGNLFPVFIDVRYNFNGGEWSPFIDLNNGWGFSSDNIVDNSRIFISGNAGVRYIVAMNVSMDFSFGLYTQAGEGIRNSFLFMKLGFELKSKKR